MTSVSSRAPLSKLPLAFAFGLVVLALVLVAGARVSGFTPQQAVAEAGIVQSRLISFEATPAGEIKVIDARTGAVIANAGSEGFIPGVLRGLNRMRRNAEADLAHAWRLDSLDNGQLMLTDTATGVSLDLNAYGSVNAQVFNQFLAPRGDNS
jgi:putative photosynthetic complex assembly protein